jgi:antitoxin CptB
MGERPQAPAAHQDDDARRRRLRWRARRGLLENDLLLERYMKRFEAQLSDDDVAGLDELLDLTDNELLDLVLERTAVPSGMSAQAFRVLGALRSV